MTLKDKYITEIRDRLTERELLELLAEESAELSQAALKLIRAKGYSDNATPKTVKECEESIVEEVADVLMVLEVLGFELPNIENNPKWERWKNRLQN